MHYSMDILVNLWFFIARALVFLATDDQFLDKTYITPLMVSRVSNYSAFRRDLVTGNCGYLGKLVLVLV